MDSLLRKVREGDRRALARAMSLADGSGESAAALQDALRKSAGEVLWWGFTGPPGVGKSTLIDALLSGLRRRNRRVGVIAVDPTSPLTNGALLGDRLRMMRHATDREVFIRSLATHHCEGGLSNGAVHCARLLELAGFDPVLIETVGVGQNEVDIAAIADLCVLILGPGYGDDIQLIKAGLLEAADLVIVNKIDLPEANRLMKDVREEVRANTKFLGVQARTGDGVEAVLDALLELDAAGREPQRLQDRRRRRVVGELRRAAASLLERRIERSLRDRATTDLLDRLERGDTTLTAAVAHLLQEAAENTQT